MYIILTKQQKMEVILWKDILRNIYQKHNVEFTIKKFIFCIKIKTTIHTIKIIKERTNHIDYQEQKVIQLANEKLNKLRELEYLNLALINIKLIEDETRFDNKFYESTKFDTSLLYLQKLYRTGNPCTDWFLFVLWMTRKQHIQIEQRQLIDAIDEEKIKEKQKEFMVTTMPKVNPNEILKQIAKRKQKRNNKIIRIYETIRDQIGIRQIESKFGNTKSIIKINLIN